ncbi:MAG TPA: helix-hairpin-helix domain-containing protein, partial [Chryseosolibacter sp.]
HRFAITFHRQKRSKAQIKTEIEELHGIGRSTANKLLRHFKSVKKIREADLEELETLVGKKKANIVKAMNNASL